MKLIILSTLLLTATSGSANLYHCAKIGPAGCYAGLDLTPGFYSWTEWGDCRATFSLSPITLGEQSVLQNIDNEMEPDSVATFIATKSRLSGERENLLVSLINNSGSLDSQFSCTEQIKTEE